MFHGTFCVHRFLLPLPGQSSFLHKPHLLTLFGLPSNDGWCWPCVPVAGYWKILRCSSCIHLDKMLLRVCSTCLNCQVHLYLLCLISLIYLHLFHFTRLINLACLLSLAFTLSGLHQNHLHPSFHHAERELLHVKHLDFVVQQHSKQWRYACWT